MKRTDKVQPAGAVLLTAMIYLITAGVSVTLAEDGALDPLKVISNEMAAHVVVESKADASDGKKNEDAKREIPCLDTSAAVGPYTIGVEDILRIEVLKPETINNQVNVSPDGSVSFPYIGSVMVKGRTVDQVQEEIQTRLGNGYMKYPLVSVTLIDSRSRKFFVYGEVLKPGAYAIEENMSVLRAISMAGGFTRFGSSSRVKVLRPRKSGPSYEPIKIKITAVMDGDCSEDLMIKSGDVVVVSEGVF
ncbi:MAG: polysaccharide biosynthesis/export family protein [Candidatus Omnitrophota bacterium]